MGYGIVQSVAPAMVRSRDGAPPHGFHASIWAAILTLFPLAIYGSLALDFYPMLGLLGGLLIFGVCFALNSS